MYRLLLALCLLLSCPAQAQQNTVSGQVRELQGKAGLPGVTILQLGTYNGVSSDAEGRFTLTIPSIPALDSVTLVVSSIGFASQRLRVAAGSTTTVLLAPDNRKLPDCGVAQPKIEVGLSSGVRYTPYGGTLKLHGSRLLRVLFAASVTYQSNLRRTHALTANLVLPPLRGHRRFSFTETLQYQQLRVESANIYFKSYTATAGLWLYHFFGNEQMPELLFGTGYSHLKPLIADATMATSGLGLSLGLRGNALSYPFHVQYHVQATHWHDYWQWQGHLTHAFADHFEAGVATNLVGPYKELSISVSRRFY